MAGALQQKAHACPQGIVASRRHRFARRNTGEQELSRPLEAEPRYEPSVPTPPPATSRPPSHLSRAIHGKDVPGYLAGFKYRFNRRYDFAAMLPRVGWAAVRTPPMFTVSSNWLRLMRNPDAAAHWGAASRSA